MATRSVTVVAPGRERSADDSAHREHAASRAVNMFYTVDDLASYFDTARVDESVDGTPVVPLPSACGEERVDEQLDRTQQRRLKHLDAVLDAVESDGRRAVITSHDAAYHFRALGAWNRGPATLYDGTRYSYGRPILDQSDLTEIIDHHDPDGAPLYAVEVVAKH